MKQILDFKERNSEAVSFPTSGETIFVMRNAILARLPHLAVTMRCDRMSRFCLMSLAAQEFAA